MVITITVSGDEMSKRTVKFLVNAGRGMVIGSVAAATLVLCACAGGPKYHTPSAAVPLAYKENGTWQVAEPNDRALRGDWWEAFQGSRLNALEEQIDPANQ